MKALVPSGVRREHRFDADASRDEKGVRAKERFGTGAAGHIFAESALPVLEVSNGYSFCSDHAGLDGRVGCRGLRHRGFPETASVIMNDWVREMEPFAAVHEARLGSSARGSVQAVVCLSLRTRIGR